jgi:hypothetical protein
LADEDDEEKWGRLRGQPSAAAMSTSACAMPHPVLDEAALGALFTPASSRLRGGRWR